MLQTRNFPRQYGKKIPNYELKKGILVHTYTNNAFLVWRAVFFGIFFFLYFLNFCIWRRYFPFVNGRCVPNRSMPSLPAIIFILHKVIHKSAKISFCFVALADNGTGILLVKRLYRHAETSLCFIWLTQVVTCIWHLKTIFLML